MIHSQQLKGTVSPGNDRDTNGRKLCISLVGVALVLSDHTTLEQYQVTSRKRVKQQQIRNIRIF